MFWEQINVLIMYINNYLQKYIVLQKKKFEFIFGGAINDYFPFNVITFRSLIAIWSQLNEILSQISTLLIN